MTTEEAIEAEFMQTFKGWAIKCFHPMDVDGYAIVLTALIKVEYRHKGAWWSQVGMKRVLHTHPRLKVIATDLQQKDFINSSAFNKWVGDDISKTHEAWLEYIGMLPNGWAVAGHWDGPLHPENCTHKHVGGKWVEGTYMDDDGAIYPTQKYTGWDLHKPVVPKTKENR